MNHYRIRYCQEYGSGYVEVTPDIATVFRVFRDGVHVRDFYPLSAANAFIQADILNHEYFPKVAARLDAFEREETIAAGYEISP
jgi:hypothetical protein